MTGPFAGSAWVTGSNGFVGARLACTLRRKGWHVATTRVRPGTSTPPPRPGDVVFHLAGIAHRRAGRRTYMAANRDLTLDLYRRAAEQGAAGFVFVSTAKVLGERAERPLGVDAPRRPAGAYAEAKASAEEQLLAASPRLRLPLAIVRPPLVYGPGARANFRTLLRAVASGLPLPLARAQGKRSVVSVVNLADALAAVGAATPMRETAIWHVTDGNDIDVATLCKSLAEMMGRKARLWGMPRTILALASRSLATSLFDPFRLDDGALREALGWCAPQTQDTALEAAARWWLRRTRALAVGRDDA